MVRSGAPLGLGDVSDLSHTEHAHIWPVASVQLAVSLAGYPKSSIRTQIPAVLRNFRPSFLSSSSSWSLITLSQFYLYN